MSSYTRTDTDLLIARIICEIYDSIGIWVTSQMITKRLQKDDQGKKIITSVLGYQKQHHKERKNQPTEKSVASNFVGQFSKGFSQKETDWHLYFDVPQSGSGSYKPKVSERTKLQERLMTNKMMLLIDLAEITQPTVDRATWEERANRLKATGKIERPTGNKAPKKVEIQSIAYERDPEVRAWILQEANGVCELCNIIGPFINLIGEPYLEVHHVITLAEGGLDIVENTVALCPSCHRRLHYGNDKKEQKEYLYSKIPRLERSF